MAFTADRAPGRVVVRFDGDSVLELTNEHLWFRTLRIDNLRTRPHGPVECISLVAACLYAYDLLRARLDVVIPDAHTACVKITPERVEHDLDRYVTETRTITIRYIPEKQRFRYDIDVRLDILRDIVAGTPHLALTPMAQWGDDDYAVIEFDDPLLAGGVGPQVPMTQDWEGIHEPWFDEHCFTTRWRKRYTTAILHTAERGWRRIPLHKTWTSPTQFYNRHILKCVPRSAFFYARSDGGYLAISHNYDAPSGHHICEWGMDMHCYALLEKARPDCLFAEGQTIQLAYSIEEIEESELPEAARNAQDAELEADEVPQVDLPIYEEPVCGFTASALDHPDAQAWRVDGAGSWEREGGRIDGHGALAIEHGASAAESRWVFRYFGPSHAGNPIPPFSRHRVSAWVRAADPDAFELAFTLVNFPGPAAFVKREPTTWTATSEHIVERDGDWMRIELLTDRCGPYVLCGDITFTYSGSGHAALAELSVAREGGDRS